MAEPDDATAVAQVHVRSWQAAYRGLIPDAVLDGLRAEDRAQRYDFSHHDQLKPKTLLAVDDAGICGFATTSPSRDADLPDHGELCALYVDPEYWGHGAGVALMKAARAQMADSGFRGALLWLLAGNERAGRFYEIDGWRADGEGRVAEVWGLALNEVRMVRKLDVSRPG